jgi:hypothetical protein
MQIPRVTARRSLVLTTVLAAVIGTSVAAASSAQAAGSHWVYSGRAVVLDTGPYSTGHVADATLCSTNSTASSTQQVPNQSVSAIATTGPATSAVRGTGNGVKSTTTISNVSLLGGKATVSSLVTSASISYQSPNFVRSYSASVTGLTVSGTPQPTEQGQWDFNLGVGLDLRVWDTSGSSTAREVSAPGTLAEHSISADSLILDVEPTNVDGYPAGVYYFGHAAATLHDPITYLTWGTGGGSSVQVGDVVTHPLKNRASIYCGGNDGLHTSASSSDAVPGVVTAGPAVSTAYSAPLGLTAATSHDVTDVSILGGLVSASRITARASSARSPGHFTSSISGTAISGLSIQGIAYTKAITPNTVIPIASVGTLYIERLITFKTGMRVYALQLVLTNDYLGAKAGTTIGVGTASAGVFNG